jgi:glycosyltransferase involved in cell wall biosynthesis
MAGMVSAPHGFAYLFEKFPSFSQTFCAREVAALRRLGVEFPVFSIRRPVDEPAQDDLAGGPVQYLPEKFDDILAGDVGFRRAARKGQERLRELWGTEKEKRRVYEALWLGPRLNAAKIRHVHVHFAGTGARTAFWLKELFDIDYSVTAHANDIFRDESPERLAQIFGAARVVVTVSDFSGRFLRENYPTLREKFCRVYNGIEMERFRPTTFPGGPPLLLSVGRYIEKKGFGDLIAACAKLGDREFECQIVGLGPLEDSLKERVATLGLQDCVLITGPRTEGEIRDLLARSRLFVLPCVNAADGAVDNLPTVIMEAMAAGLPVVSTSVAGVPEMVIDGKTGFVVPEKDPAALAERMARLLEEETLAREMGGAGREMCGGLFAGERTSSALLEVFRSHGAVRGI